MKLTNEVYDFLKRSTFTIPKLAKEIYSVTIIKLAIPD